MRKTVQVNADIDVLHIESQNVLYVKFQDGDVTQVCLGLASLLLGLIDRLTLVGKTKYKLRMYMNNEKGNLEFNWNDPGIVDVGLDQNALEYCAAFFLKNWRDGAAEVNHVDLDLLHPSGSDDMTLTFEVPLFQPPVSAEEVRRRLGV